MCGRGVKPSAQKLIGKKETFSDSRILNVAMIVRNPPFGVKKKQTRYLGFIYAISFFFLICHKFLFHNFFLSIISLLIQLLWQLFSIGSKFLKHSYYNICNSRLVSKCGLSTSTANTWDTWKT